MSAVSVSIVLGDEESCAHSSAHFHNTFRIPKGMRLDQLVLWRRYVDDLLCLSWAYCAYCMENMMKATYTEQLSITHRTSLLDPQAPFEWTDLEHRCTPRGLFKNIKNRNRQWLRHIAEHQWHHPRPHRSIIAWPDHMPSPFATIRAVFRGRLVRCLHLQLGEHLTANALLEVAVEMICFRYPRSLIRALLHDLPSVPAACRARKVYRSWLR